MHHLHTIDYAIILFYLAATTLIGLALTRKASSSLDHYYLGGRTMPWWLLGVAGMSNWFDLTGTMIITSFLYMLGPRGLYIEFRGGAVLILAFLLVYAGKWHRRSGCMTLAEWMAFRFGRGPSTEMVRMIVSLTMLITTIASLAYLVRGTSLFVGQIVPYSPTLVTIILIALTALYTMFGGFYGVVVTDLIQGVIIMISCLVIGLLAWNRIPDAANLAATATAVTANANWTDTLPAWHTTMPKGYEMYESLILFAGFYFLRNALGGMGSGAENRYFAARSDRDCGLQSLLQMITTMMRWPLMMGFAVLGIYLVFELFPNQQVIGQVRDVVHAAYPEVPQGLWHNLTASIAASPQKFAPDLIAQIQSLLGDNWTKKLYLVGYEGGINPEQILPAVLLTSVPMGLAGFIIVAMLAAMKGTLAGMVNMTSAYFVKDIYQNYIRPKAGTHELIFAAWASTLIMMTMSVYMGLYAKSINALWGWIIMGLTAGGLAPSMLRLYWWRTTSIGVIIGSVMGGSGALLQYFLLPEMLEWKQFLIMSGLSFLGTIVGSYLSSPPEREILRNFYQVTRPFGIWGPIRRSFTPEEQCELTKEHRCDIIAVPFTLLTQVTLFLLPMQLVIKAYTAFLYTLPVFFVGAVGMYFFWWRKLPDNETGPLVDSCPVDPLASAEASPPVVSAVNLNVSVDR